MFIAVTLSTNYKIPPCNWIKTAGGFRIKTNFQQCYAQLKHSGRYILRNKIMLLNTTIDNIPMHYYII